MSTPIFPSVGEDGKIRDKHLPDRLSDTALNEKIQLTERGDWEAVEAYERGDVVNHDDSRWVAQPSVTRVERTNHLLNPRFLNSRAGWSAGVQATLSATPPGLTVTMTEALEEWKVVAQPNVPSRVNATGEAVVSVGAVVTVPAGGTAVDIMVGPAWYPTPSWDFPQVTVQPGETRRLTVDGATIPDRKNEIALFVCAGPGTPVGAVFVVSEPILEFAPTVGSYFDGDTPDIEGEASVVHEWVGDPEGSASTRLAEETSTLIVSVPGQGPDWVRLGVLQTDSSSPAVRPPAPPASIPPPELVTIYATDLTSDGLRLLSITGWHIRESTDEGKTWTTLSNFQTLGYPLPSQGRWLPDGEIIVRTRGADDSDGSHIYRSQGAASGTPTWTKVHVFNTSTPGTAHGWSWSVHENIILIAEYGTDKSGVDNSRHVYMSIDMGRSFRTIFELPNDKGIHMHGVAWDPWWDRIWITWGDDLDGWQFSDDLGETWHFAKYGDYPGASMQAVGIFPLKDAILFASDGAPNGLWRIPRSQGKHQGLYEPEVAFQFNDVDRLTHLCHAIYQRSPSHPVVMGWGSEVLPGQSRVLATYDGYHVVDVWEDPYTSEAGRGIRSVVGPTARGNLMWEKQDGESAAAGTGRLRYTVPWPEGYPT